MNISMRILPLALCGSSLTLGLSYSHSVVSAQNAPLVSDPATGSI